MPLSLVSQNISKGEIKTIVNSHGDTLIMMRLDDAKIILSDLMELRVVDSLLSIYKLRDSLNSSTITLQKNVIDKLTQKSDNQNIQLTNFQSILNNKNQEIFFKEDVIKAQKKEIRKQKVLKILGFVGSVVLPTVVVLIID